MPMIRLVPERKSHEDNILYDIDFSTVPKVGDFIVMELGKGIKATYEVMARFFYVGQQSELSAENERITLEVKEKKPSTTTYSDML